MLLRRTQMLVALDMKESLTYVTRPLCNEFEEQRRIDVFA